jgi:hypothetical protein
LVRASSEPLRLDATGEELEIVSPDGTAEVRISFTPDGPIVTVRAARIRLDGRDLRLSLDRLEVETRDELRLRSKGDVHVDGAVVRLNCAEPRELG